VACKTCGLVQQVDDLPAGAVAKCARCHFGIEVRKTNSRSRTAALSFAALVLFFPANYFPIVETIYMGSHEETTIFEGIRGLFQQGSYFVGSLVFTTSILSPFLKIIALLALSLTINSTQCRHFRKWMFRLVQIIDPWNMLEVTMLAILVSIAELGNIATVHPGAGVFSFACVVFLTLCATLTFDPRLVWDPPATESHA
jgi:paraquat-inducible protein A